jgi:hypothetical protein
MKSRMFRLCGTLLAFVLLMSGCGLEVVIGLAGRSEHKAPKVEKATILKGKVTGLTSASIKVLLAGAEIATGTAEGNGDFSIELPKGNDYSNLIVTASVGSAVLKTVVAEVKREETTNIGQVNLTTTTATIILEARLSAQGLDVINYPTQGIKIAFLKLPQELEKNAAMKAFKDIVDKVHTAAQKAEGSAYLRSPRFKMAADGKTLEPVSSGLNPDIADTLDYCSDKALGCQDGKETDTNPFDKALAAAAQALSLPTCTYDKEIRLVLTVNLNSKILNGNCKTYNLFKHAKRYGGQSCENCSVYVAAGVHRDSGIQDPKIAQLLENWEPNRLQMYDNGTNGDLVAGDGIWTLSLKVPAPKDTGKTCKVDTDCPKSDVCTGGTCKTVLRLGYKYTYGLNGDVWGGTEEFPGNQRLLEVVDLNGDGIVARHDNFADEATNKDKVNTLSKEGASGLVCFREPDKSKCQNINPSKNDPDCGCKVDANGDGIADTRELPRDQDNDCKTDGYRVFANVQPLTLQCK